jgi:predicted ATP-binding protein involved in virulence
MRIDTIELKNFRGFDAFRRDFGPGINVLVGDNGSGKTALLDALAIGIGSCFLQVDAVPSRAIERDDVRLVVQEVGEATDTSPQYPVELSFEGEVFGKRHRWSRSLNGKNRRTTHQGAAEVSEAVRMRFTLQTLKEIASRQGFETLPLIAYHGTGRLWVQRRTWTATRTKRKRARLDGYQNCLDAASDEKGFLDWFKTMEWTAYQEEKEPLTLRAVRETIRGLVPGCTDLRYRSKEGELVALFEDGRRLPTRLLSDGFRTVLGLAADLAWRCATLNPQLGERAALETPGVALVDEIDLHLHPNWQRRIVDDLRRSFPRVQFFLTTHSPFVVQSLGSDEVVPLSGPAHLDKPPFKRSVEEVSAEVLGVKHVERSRRFQEMEQAAKRLIELLDEAGGQRGQALERARDSYLDLVARYGDDPAFLAVLKAEGALRGVRLDDAGGSASR